MRGLSAAPGPQKNPASSRQRLTQEKRTGDPWALTTARGRTPPSWLPASALRATRSAGMRIT